MSLYLIIYVVIRNQISYIGDITYIGTILFLTSFCKCLYKLSPCCSRNMRIVKHHGETLFFTVLHFKECIDENFTEVLVKSCRLSK